ncbi:hypothetical protein ES703_76915 [subsurface metagenome]
MERLLLFYCSVDVQDISLYRIENHCSLLLKKEQSIGRFEPQSFSNLLRNGNLSFGSNSGSGHFILLIFVFSITLYSDFYFCQISRRMELPPYLSISDLTRWSKNWQSRIWQLNFD